ncbi:lipoprotein [Comamonas nitrativorans]|uniref:Lipoprotein n=1 Tax=Comamonas nitrativorans TaxID=108437 RepID=A0ABV9GXT6_9BURK
MPRSSSLARLLCAAAVAAVLTVLSGCGQRGPLFLPDSAAAALPAPLPAQI